jgi:four helix bundle protein
MVRGYSTRTKIKSFRDLEIWQRSIKLAEEVYQATKAFPKEELYALTSQTRRSVISISSNIAEGFARNHNKEYKQFLHIALGSCAELTTQIEIASRLGYIENRNLGILLGEIEQISKMTMSLIKKIKTDNQRLLTNDY